MRGEDVSFTDVKIKIPDRKVDQRMWLTSCTGSARGVFCVFWRKSVSWELDFEREGSTFGARWGQTNLCSTGTTHVEGRRWKSQNRKNVYLSPYVKKPSNSKVIKSFVPELRSRKCFSCFGIPMFYVYMLWTFCVRFKYPYLAMVHKHSDFILVWQFYSLFSLFNSLKRFFFVFFLHQLTLMVFHWRLSDSKSSQVFSRSQQCCSLGGLHSTSFFQVL